MNLCYGLFVGLGLLAVSTSAPTPEPAAVNAACTTLTWSQQDTYQMTGSSWSWFDAKQLAANYVGPGTDGVTYSDWRLPTKAEYQAGVTAGITGQWPNPGTFHWWTSQSKGSQQSWTASFIIAPNGEPSSTQTVQYAYFNSTYSYISAKFVRP